MRLMAAHAVSRHTRDVIEDEGPPLLRVARNTRQLVGPRAPERRLSAFSVRIVARGAVHAPFEAVRERFVMERRRLARVAGGAQNNRLLLEQRSSLRLRSMHRVATQAVDRRRVRMDAVSE